MHRTIYFRQKERREGRKEGIQRKEIGNGRREGGVEEKEERERE